MMIVLSGETLAQLSARYHLPGCMILRANRIFSEGWLTPGRELFVPPRDFCRSDDFPCPVWALQEQAKECVDHYDG